MIILITEKGRDSSYLAPLKKADCDVREFAYRGGNSEEILALKPSLIVLCHRMALLQCKSLRNAATGDGPRVRMIVIAPMDFKNTISCYIAGADVCMLEPISDAILRHAAGNECAKYRRDVEAREMIASETLISGKYRVKGVLGIGLHSVMLLCENRYNNQTVVIKLLRRILAMNQPIANDFLRSAQKIQGIRSAELVELLETGQWNGQPYLVFNFGPAKNLYQVMAERQLSELEIAKLGLTIVRGLLTMKHFNLLHLDIRPENILYRNGRYFLCEFGILTPGSELRGISGFPYWCDPAFACPEFFGTSTALTARSDIYSLGVLLASALTHENPFAGLPAALIAQNYLKGAKICFDDCEPQISPSLRTTLESMTDPRVRTRPRLRELEVIFYQLVALKSGAFPEEPLGQSEVDVPSATVDGGMEPQIIDHNIAENGSNTSRVIKPENIAATLHRPTPLDAEYWTKRRIRICIGALSGIILLLVLLGLLIRSSRTEPIRQGPLMMFTCYSGHTHADRTLDFRHIKCKTCGDDTTPSYTCRACGKIFGQSIWPKRNMTEEQCVKFEEKLLRCPFCKSSRIVPTAVVRKSDARKSTR
ncbi:MAG: protein kinase [Victivallaceae bacterium]|nr:protein kinase [Victivallaceae bacterium]